MSTDVSIVDRGAADGLVGAWIESEVAAHPLLRNIEQISAERRWIVRLEGDEKDVVAVWFTVDQRTVHVESQVIPEPEEGHAQVYEYALRRNRHGVGWCWMIGPVDSGLYVSARLPLAGLDHDQLDRILGSIYAEVEQGFRAVLRLGFASRLSK